MNILVKYEEYLILKNKQPMVGDVIYCVQNGNFGEHKITSIDRNGWIYIYDRWLVGIENLYIKITVNSNYL